jgi:3-hydroxybutyryl-CoA dehydratase
VQQGLRYFAQLIQSIGQIKQGKHMTSMANGQTSLGHGFYLEDLAPDMEASVSKVITDEDVKAFAGLSGDVNPVHLDDEFASGTIFKKRIAHGFLTGALFSTVLGTKLPGPGCIYLSQGLKFRAPV